MTDIEFTIPGVPVAQPRQRHAIRGKFVANYTPSKHPVNAFKAVAIMAAQAVCSEPIDQPVLLWVTFIMPRPATMTRKTKPNPRAWHAKKPDLDNLEKSLLDALTTAGVWRDDSQVVWVNKQKIIAAGDEQPCVMVRIRTARELT